MELSFAAASSREKRDLLDGQQQQADHAVYEQHFDDPRATPVTVLIASCAWP